MVSESSAACAIQYDSSNRATSCCIAVVCTRHLHQLQGQQFHLLGRKSAHGKTALHDVSSSYSMPLYKLYETDMHNKLLVVS